ncbi:hypothetical protein ZIOFF_010592 [Zingiber officinale]|uniref:Uncharacterized protein n=1 Tax=Zingiber officinale TaxID=94328 RepID=A0A8J5HJD7_ZINOF|nr:hypothetical protein ZIOFF_010592 [Zingiber officinale]
MGSNRRAASFFLLLLFLFASQPCWKPAAASPGRWRTACNETEGSGSRCRVEVEGEGEEAEEFQFDSEISRRLLAGSDPRGLSYGGFDPNKPVCKSQNGQPYNCAGRSGNPPRRGCLVLIQPIDGLHQSLSMYFLKSLESSEISFSDVIMTKE